MMRPVLFFNLCGEVSATGIWNLPNPSLVNKTPMTRLNRKPAIQLVGHLDQILLLLNPFMPYITEELYESLAVRPKDALLMGQKWPEYDSAWIDEKGAGEIAWLIRSISNIRSVRADMNVPAGAMVRLLVKDAGANTVQYLKTYDEILRRMARIESVALSHEVPKGSIQTIVDEATFVLPIAEIIDLVKSGTVCAKRLKSCVSILVRLTRNFRTKNLSRGLRLKSSRNKKAAKRITRQQ
jgi:valyl-tRNA synthetase